jgi:hypothetical protein
MNNDKFRLVVVSLDEFRADSIYWDLLIAEKEHYYRLYKHHGGSLPMERFLGDLFVEAYPADQYEIEANYDSEESDGVSDGMSDEDSRPRAYRAKSGGDYVYDPDGDFFQVRRKNQEGQICEIFYVHRSQFFKPLPYVQSAMGVIASAMAVAFQSAQVLMAQMANYVREAEMINAEIVSLNILYADLNLLLSSFTNLGNKYAAVVVYPEQHLWQQLADLGFVELSHFIKMGIKFRPILLEIDLTDPEDPDWLAFRLEYSHSQDKIVSYQYPRKQQWGTTKDWIKNDRGEALGQIGNDPWAARSYTDAETVAKIIGLENASIHFNINTVKRLLLGGDDSKCYDTSYYSSRWYQSSLIMQHEKFGGGYDSGYNGDSRNDFQIALTRYFNPNDGKTVQQIIDGNLKSIIRLWDARKYVDDVRQRIECVNNRLQGATTYTSMTNQDMQANFSVATNIISSTGQQLYQATKCIRT